jgi:hypothetical protein
MRHTFQIQIANHPKKPDWYIARYESGFLGALYSVEFANTLLGAVALYHFIDMLKSRYPNERVTFQLPTHAGSHPVTAVREAWSMAHT